MPARVTAVDDMSLTPRLLPGHGDAEAFLRVDEVIVVVVAEIDLHPMNLAPETARSRRVVGGDGGTGLMADVGGFVCGEDHGLGGLHAVAPHRGPVVIQR